MGNWDVYKTVTHNKYVLKLIKKFKETFHIIWLILCSVSVQYGYLYSMTFYILAMTDNFSSEDNIILFYHNRLERVQPLVLESFFLLLGYK